MMHKNHWRLFVPFFFFCLLFATSPVAAQKTFYYEAFDVEIQLLEDGDLAVTERQSVVFDGGTFSYGYATIPYRRIDAIRDVRVSEDGQSYSQSSSEQPYTFSLEDTGDQLVIYWYFPATQGRHTYTFEYTVEGAIRSEESGHQIYWTAIPSDVPGDVESSHVTIRLLQGMKIGSTLAQINGSDTSEVVQTINEDGDTATFVMNRYFRSGDLLEVGARFSADQLALRVPEWQLIEEEEQRITLFSMLGAIAIGILGPLGVLVLWYGKGRDPDPGVVPSYLAEPPSPLPAGLMGTLIDEKAQLRDVIAALMDLARRGYVQIKEMERDHLYTRTDKSADGLLTHEQKLLQLFFNNRTERPLSSLKDKFYAYLPQIQDAMYSDLVSQGLMRAKPNRVRSFYRVLAGLGVILAAVLLFLLPNTPPYTSLFCLPLALASGIIALFIAAGAMPQKTDKGAEARATWQAFRTFLQDVEKYTDVTQKTEIFERFLPYAIAFGMERQWINRFAKIPNTTPPIWYEPFPRPYYGYPRYGGASGPIIGGGQQGAENRPNMGGGLEGMSKGMTQSLEGMSKSLTSMLNSTSTIMRSVPAPSSSSSGGSRGGRSGGGGFSGGFGGGSSGGGSRGFG